MTLIARRGAAGRGLQPSGCGGGGCGLWLRRGLRPSGRGGCWGPVAVQGAFAVGAGGGGGAVGVEGDLPAPLVDGDEVVEGAEQDQVSQGGGAAFGSGRD